MTMAETQSPNGKIDPELFRAFAEEIRNQPREALLLVPRGREDDALMLSPETVWTLIGQLHLALRHPDNTGLPRDKTEAFLEWLRMVFVQPGSAGEKVFEQGSDPRFDI